MSILTHCKITSVAQGQRYTVVCNKGTFSAESLVIATGGLSIPKMGASDFGYRLARQFGVNVRETRAGLVPFVFSGAVQELMERLSGISLQRCPQHLRCDFRRRCSVHPSWAQRTSRSTTVQLLGAGQ